MSLFIYVNNNYSEISSLEIKDITDYEELLNFIKNKINTKKKIDVYTNLSILDTITIIKNETKINNNFLVFSDSDSELVPMTNIKSLNNDYLKMPIKLTYCIFKKCNNKKLYLSSNLSKELNDDDYIYEISKKYKLFYVNIY
jgi:hypothetical protein